ncbi:MAG: LysM peptidoglycan-binding domain-containing protein [Oscillospiraceae bacterium]|nr:LysM peptidoglycan-binding domain-containing protein [Oscillospiraceae bacterium]
MFLYTVRPGDSVYAIARMFGIYPQSIIEGNQIGNPELLVVGQSLAIPADSVSYTVAQGDTLNEISLRYQVPISAILQANPGITDESLIFAGQVITIPPQLSFLGSKRVNGYAFPNINQNTLQRTLPGLTYCSIFSYQVNADGTLNEIEDQDVIRISRNARVAPIMVITNLVTGEGFSSELAHTILTDNAVQNRLLDNVLQTLGTKNYYGLNIDFEYINPSDREAYNTFVQNAAERLHNAGYILMTSLAPKTSGDQPGLLYEAHDYPVHGQFADYVILMTYEWGYTYGPARAVAPLNLVEQVIQYAVSVIPNQKILMGIPNYGYNWTLPFVSGSAARPLTNPGAVELAGRVGARILFDEESQSPHFNYYDTDGREHEVWFEDARSINAKLHLADRYGLGGVSYWTINSYFAQNWQVLHTLFQVEKVL